MRNFTVAFIIAFAVAACRNNEIGNTDGERMLVTVKRNYDDRPAQEDVTVVVDLNEITRCLPSLASAPPLVTDQHFGTTLNAYIADTDGDGKDDKLVVHYPFRSKEPVYTMMVEPGTNVTATPLSGSVKSDERLTTTCLRSYGVYAGSDSITDWPHRIFESTLNAYPDPASLSVFSPGEWNYEHGLFLNAGFELWKRTGKDAYLKYIKEWVDRFLTEDGHIKETEYDVKKYRLDDILPGRLCISLYQQTGDERYRTAATQLADHLRKQPRTKEGGYWHKEIYPDQMWLDGIYMADVFSMQYAAAFNEPQFFDEAVHQIKLITAHTTDAATGLMYHGWDESKNPVWANPETGTSSEFWARSIGWFAMALIECLDYLPENHPERKDVISIFQHLSENVARYQDPSTSLWYQVVNKAGQPGNWVETSASAMFAYAFAKGYRKGHLEKTYYDRARKAFDAMITSHCYFDDNGNLYLNQTVKVGTLNPKVSKGDYAYYISGERRINDFKGLSPLLYTSMELNAETSAASLAQTREETE